MAKKKVKVAYNTDGYNRVKKGKPEYVRKYEKEIDIPTIPAKDKKNIKQGKAKKLIDPKKEQDIKDFAILASKYQKESLSGKVKELGPQLDIYLGKYDSEITQWISRNVKHPYYVRWWQEPIIYYEGVYNKEIDINEFIEQNKEGQLYKGDYSLAFNKLAYEIIGDITKPDTKDKNTKAKKTITISDAKELFENKSEKAKMMDLSKEAQTIHKTPNEEWVKATNRSDVKGIDTKKDIITVKDAKELFENKSEKAKMMDLSKEAQTIHKTPNEEWVKATNRSDVKGIDTKKTKEKLILENEVEEYLSGK